MEFPIYILTDEEYKYPKFQVSIFQNVHYKIVSFNYVTCPAYFKRLHYNKYNRTLNVGALVLFWQSCQNSDIHSFISVYQ